MLVAPILVSLLHKFQIGLMRPSAADSLAADDEKEDFSK